MIGLGTLLNVLTVLVGGLLGARFGERLPPRVRESVINVLGLFTIAYGLSQFFASQNSLITLGSVLIGGLLGEWWRIEEQLRKLGAWLEARFARSGSSESTARFIRGFVTASLVFCVGPMTILGSFEDGLTGSFQTLAIKSVLDGFAALAFASSLGAGVMFSALVIFLYQGALTLLAVQAQAVLTAPMIAEMTAAGGLLIMGIGFGALLELRPIRVANYLPALVIAPLIVAALTALGIPLSPR
jgi:uncharacterized membrane protein YqgA involved in biofilm formation